VTEFDSEKTAVLNAV